MSITKEPFGKTAQGIPVELYTLTNKNGLKLAVATYGAKLVQLHVPDKNGVFADIITGFDTLEPYLIRNPYFGALVGRCANRIAGAKFVLGGREYTLDCNAPPNHLHGGLGGFDKYVWAAQAIEENGEEALELKILSPDGDQGYPGNLWVTVRYALTEADELSIAYFAHCDADTIVNLTNHSYFNLAGHNTGNVLEHRIHIDADTVTEAGEGGIPTGKLIKVQGTPFDLRGMARIGDRIHQNHEQLNRNEGFDVNYVLNRRGDGLQSVCVVEEPTSGRHMEVLTTMPGMQFYTANYIKGSFVFTGKGGYLYGQHCGLCLETQFMPDTPNIPAFGSIVLHPGEVYRHRTVYAFSQKK